MRKKLTIGRLAKERREELGLTRAQVAQRLRNVNDRTASASWLTQLEQDQIAFPSARRLMRLESALEVEFGYFMSQVIGPEVGR
jgi:transcriptional regulator with XRE-family HTH domain